MFSQFLLLNWVGFEFRILLLQNCFFSSYENLPMKAYTHSLISKWVGVFCVRNSPKIESHQANQCENFCGKFIQIIIIIIGISSVKYERQKRTTTTSYKLSTEFLGHRYHGRRINSSNYSLESKSFAGSHQSKFIIA